MQEQSPCQNGRSVDWQRARLEPCLSTAGGAGALCVAKDRAAEWRAVALCRVASLAVRSRRCRRAVLCAARCFFGACLRLEARSQRSAGARNWCDDDVPQSGRAATISCFHGCAVIMAGCVRDLHFGGRVVVMAGCVRDVRSKWHAGTVAGRVRDVRSKWHALVWIRGSCQRLPAVAQAGQLFAPSI